MRIETPDWVNQLPRFAREIWLGGMQGIAQQLEQITTKPGRGVTEIQQETIRQLRHRWTTYMREPVPGEIDPDKLLTWLGATTNSISDSLPDVNGWLHPVTWMLLAQDGRFQSDELSLSFTQDDKTIRLYPLSTVDLDTVTISITAGKPNLTAHLPPPFLSTIPNGTVLYEKLRTDGVSPTRALLVCADTLNDEQVTWMTDWFGPTGGQNWHEYARNTAMLAADHTRRVKDVDFKTHQAILEGADDEQLLHLMQRQRHNVHTLLKTWQQWSQIVSKPGPCPFDLDRALTTLMSRPIEPGQAYSAMCPPAVYIHLATKATMTVDERYVLTSEDKKIFELVATNWGEEDAIGLSIPGNDRAHVFLAPRNYTDTQSLAYQYAREQGMTISDALESSGFAGGDHTVTLRSTGKPGPDTQKSVNK